MISDHVYRYVRERHARGEWSDRTAQSNRYRLLDFATTVDHLEPPQLNRRHVERWLERPGLSVGYRRHRLAALRGFSRWMADTKRCPRDITDGIKAPRQPTYAPRALNGPQVAAILAACPSRRERVAVLLGVQEGLRRGEMTACQVGDIDLVGRSIAVRGKGGRGRVTRLLPLSDQTWHEVDRYLSETGATAGPLLRSRIHPDRGILPEYLTGLISAVMAEAGVKHGPRDGRSAHALRHTMAEDLFSGGADVREVQHALGHESMQSTQVYLRARPDELRGVMAGRSYG